MKEKEFNLKLKTIPNTIKEWLEELGFRDIGGVEFDGGSIFVFRNNDWNNYKAVKFEMRLWDFNCEEELEFEAQKYDHRWALYPLEDLLIWWNEENES